MLCVLYWKHSHLLNATTNRRTIEMDGTHEASDRVYKRNVLRWRPADLAVIYECDGYSYTPMLLLHDSFAVYSPVKYIINSIGLMDGWMSAKKSKIIWNLMALPANAHRPRRRSTLGFQSHFSGSYVCTSVCCRFVARKQKHKN